MCTIIYLEMWSFLPEVEHKANYAALGSICVLNG